MIIDRVYVYFWLGLSPLAVLSMMVLLKDGITYQSFLISIVLGLPQFILLSLMPMASWIDNNKRNKLLTTGLNSDIIHTIK